MSLLKYYRKVFRINFKTQQRYSLSRYHFENIKINLQQIEDQIGEIMEILVKKQGNNRDEEFSITVTDDFSLMLQDMHNNYPLQRQRCWMQAQYGEEFFQNLFQKSINGLKGQVLQIKYKIYDETNQEDYIQILYNDKIMINIVRQPGDRSVPSCQMCIYYNMHCKNFQCVDSVIPVPYIHYRDVDFTIALDNLKNFARTQQESLRQSYQYIAMQTQLDKVFRKEIKYHIQEVAGIGITQQQQDSCENILKEKQ